MDLCTPRRWQVVLSNHLTLYFIMELSIGFIVVIAIASFVALSVFFHFVECRDCPTAILSFTVSAAPVCAFSI